MEHKAIVEIKEAMDYFEKDRELNKTHFFSDVTFSHLRQCIYTILDFAECFLNENEKLGVQYYVNLASYVNGGLEGFFGWVKALDGHLKCGFDVNIHVLVDDTVYT